MNKQTQKEISLFTKISLIANVLLFGAIGTIYLMEDRNLVAIILFSGSLLNIIWALFAIPVRNILFAILNFIYSIMAIAIGVDFQFADSPYLAMLWFATGLIYIIIGFVVLLLRKRKKDFVNKAEEQVGFTEKEDVLVKNQDF